MCHSAEKEMPREERRKMKVKVVIYRNSSCGFTSQTLLEAARNE